MNRVPARIVRRVWTPFLEGLQAKHQAFLDALDDRLMEAAERAVDSQRAAQNLRLSRQLRMGTQPLLARFREGLAEALLHDDEPEDDASEAELTLMDSADTEREVALRKVVAGARSAMAAELEALETLTSDYQLAEAPETAPWHPHAMGNAFLVALESIPLEGNDALMLLHWFDRDVIRHLQPEMQALLAGFAEAGLAVPEFRPTPARTRDARTPGHAPPGTSNGAREADGSTGGPPGADWGQFGYYAPVAGPLVAASQGTGASPRDAVNTILSTTTQGALEPFVMDLLQGLFDLILNRDDLNPALREPLSDLQLPLVRIAMAETHFFRDREHPARQMTGLLLNIALRVDPDLPLEEARTLPLARLVQEHVDYLRNKGLNDSTAYEKALNTLRQDIRAAEDDVIRQAADARAEAQKEEQHLQISHHIEATVHRTVLSMGQDLPDTAQQQLMDAWVPLLAAHQTADAEGTASEPGNPDNNAVPAEPATADVIPLPTGEARETPTGKTEAEGEGPAGLALLKELLQLMREEPDFKASAPLLARIRGYLERAPLSTEERARIKSDLVSAHLMAAGRKRTQTDPSRQTSTAPQSDTPESGFQRRPPRPSGQFGEATRHADDDPSLMRDHNDEHVQRADSLATGTWIQFTSPAGTRITRMKLVWRGAHAGRLLFTDAAGRSKRQHSVQGLGHEFRTGRAQVIPEESLFDHLMEQRLGASS
ncbi:MAG: DUF1631 family protein [Pseudomonadota bacterium]